MGQTKIDFCLRIFIAPSFVRAFNSVEYSRIHLKYIYIVIYLVNNYNYVIYMNGNTIRFFMMKLNQFKADRQTDTQSETMTMTMKRSQMQGKTT